MPKITPTLWFNGQAEEAMRFYVSVFPDAEAGPITRFGSAREGHEGQVMTASFTLDGVSYLALNGGPQYKFSEAISFQIDCPTQADVDYYWDRLTADGGEPGPCGWLKDRFGVSWQVVPSELPALLGGSDSDKSSRAMQAMMSMSKLDIAALKAAYEGV